MDTVKRKSTAVKFNEDGTVSRDDNVEGIGEDEGLDNAITAMLIHKTNKKVAE